MDIQEVWDKCLRFVRDNINPQSYKTWFEPIKPVELREKTLVIQVPSHFFYEWLEEHYISLLREAIRKYVGADGKLEYLVPFDNQPGEQGKSLVTIPTLSKDYSTKNPPVNLPLTKDKEIPNPMVIPGLRKVKIDPCLNPYYTFDSFIEGDGNKLTRSAAVSVAQNPGETAFNPLLIYGGVGLGKTHLAQAIGNEIKRTQPEKVVLYVTTEKFGNSYVDSVKNNNISDFVNFYQLIDVLIVDDIQYIMSKTGTQDIFFHVFNNLHTSNRQIILTCDMPPNELKGIDERLLSRFKWGLNAELQPPDHETRLEILRQKMYREGIGVKDIPEEVLEYIAYNITSNVRELEGAMIALIAQTLLMRQEITLELARKIVKNFVQNANREISIDSIQKIVSEYFQLPVEKLKEKTRKREVVQARQISMYFAKQYTKSSLKTIGLHFGGRDHSTVIHALNTVNDLMTTDKKFHQYVEDIQKRIKLCTS